MKTLKLIFLLLFLSSINIKAQSSAHYIVSDYNILVGDSAKIVPIVHNIRPNSKTILILNSIEGETYRNNLKPFYFSNNFPGNFTLTLHLKLIENGKIYFEDTQYLDFHMYKMCGDIYMPNDTITTYLGFEYPIKINVNLFSSTDIIINARGINIRKAKDDFQYVLTNTQLGIAQITILGRKNDGSTVMINKIPIKTVALPAPAVVANILPEDSTIEIKSILNDQFMFKCTSGVDSFTVSFEKSGKKISKKIIGSRIDTLTYLELMSLPPKTWIYFEDIYHWINFPGGENKKSNIAITIP